MAKSKFKVTKGLANAITTGEPVFVKRFYTDIDTGEEYALIVRPVVTQNGIEHREEAIPTEQLETRYEQAKRALEFEQFVQAIREEAEQKRYALPTGIKKMLEKNGQQVLPFNGNGDING